MSEVTRDGQSMTPPTQVCFTVPGVPIAQPRQRNAAVNGHQVNYTPAKHPVNVFKAAVLLAARQAYQGPTIEGPVALTVEFYFPRPQRLLTKRAPDGPVPHTSRPDDENILKGLQDALSGYLWRDDAQICDLTLKKRYVAKDAQPQTVVLVTPVGG